MSGTQNINSAPVLRQLYFLRNITISFVTVMALLAYFGLGIQLPLIPLSIILLIMAVTNLFTRLNIDSNRIPGQRSIFAQLLVEILSFSLILFFTGGATNPFTFFYLIPLAIAAILIPGRLTWILTLLTLVIYSLLMEYFIPLRYPMHDHGLQSGNSHQFNQHVIGMWFGFMVSALLVTWFITYLARELKRRDAAIHQARQREIRDQQLVSLGALAAGTAHELGTPLASLAIVTDELTDGIDPQQHPDLFEYQDILRQQIARCKKILSVLSESAGVNRADSGRLVKPVELIELALQHWQNQQQDPPYRLSIDDSIDRAGPLLCDTPLLQSIGNLLNNALQASDQPILVEAACDGNGFILTITDHGQGLSAEQLQLAGNSGFTSKPDGMGIGLFLALNNIQRAGGTVQFEPASPNGTITRITLPLMEEGLDE